MIFCVTCHKRPIDETRSKIRCSHCLDDRKQANKTYSKTHREEIYARTRTWKQENPQKVSEQHKRAWDKYPGYYERYNKKWKHSEAGKISSEKRRARKLGIDNHFSKEEWLQILEKYDHSCLCCGSKDDLQPDHVVPLALGGSNTIDNIQPLCGKCNRRKHTKVIDFREVHHDFLSLQ